MKKTSIVAFLAVILVVLGGVGYLFNKKEESKPIKLETLEPTNKEKYNIYSIIVKKDFVEKNEDSLEDIGLDINKPLHNQVNKHTGKSWEDYFNGLTKDYMNSMESLSRESYKDKNFKYKESVLFSDFPNDNNLKKLKDKYEYQNKFVEDTFKMDYKKVYYVINDIYRAKKYMLYKMKEYNPSDEEVKKYISENEKSLNTYMFHSSTFDTEKDAKSFKSDVEKYGNFKDKALKNLDKQSRKLLKDYNSDPTMLITTIYGISNPGVIKWLVEPNRKEGDISIIKNENTGEYDVVQFEEGYLDKRCSHNVDIIIYTDKEKANNFYERLKKTKNLDKAFKDEANKQNQKAYNHKGIFGYGKNAKDFDYWVSRKERKKNDIDIIVTDLGTMVVKYNKKNNDIKYIEDAKKELKNIYANKLYKKGRVE